MELSGVSDSQRELVDVMVKELSEACGSVSGAASRDRLMFYEAVRAGCSDLVRAVLDDLERAGDVQLLDWVLGRVKVKVQTPPRKSTLSKLLFVPTLAGFLVSFLAIYCVHQLCLFLHWRSRRRLRDRVDHPLVLAVLSEDKQVIRLFLDKGAAVEYTDGRGNNFFHYMADISASNPDKAVDRHRILCDVLQDSSRVRHCIVDLENDSRDSALDVLIKYGSVVYADYIMKYHGLFGQLKLAVSKDRFWIKTKNTEFDVQSPKTPSSRVDDPGVLEKARVFRWDFDLSGYQRGDALGQQSHPLRLFAQRSLTGLLQQDAEAFVQSDLLSAWIALKWKTYFWWVVFSHFMSLVFSACVFAYLIVNHGDMNQFPVSLNFLNAYIDAVKTNSTDTVRELFAASSVPCEIDITEQDIDLILQGRTPTNYRAEINLLVRLGTTLVTIFVLVELAVNLTFLFRNYNFRAATYADAMSPVMSNNLAGSYFEKQTALVSYLLIYLNYYLFDSRTAISAEFFSALIDHMNSRADYLNGTVSYKSEMRELATVEHLYRDMHYFVNLVSLGMVLCLLLRFLIIVHALRLLPLVGFFVITMKRMGEVLLQFMIIFFVVVLVFALLFAMTLRSPDCPRHIQQGFRSLPDAMYNTYLAVLGNINADFSVSINTRIIYLLLTYVLVIMLLNLIIAVMTTVATDISASPWRGVICRTELLTEVLGVEAGVLIVSQPLRKLASVVRCRRRVVDITTPGHQRFQVAYYNEGATSG